MDFGEQMFTKASQNSDISASCSEKIVTVAFLYKRQIVSVLY
jgi:hypothetical protein